MRRKAKLRGLEENDGVHTAVQGCNTSIRNHRNIIERSDESSIVHTADPFSWGLNENKDKLRDAIPKRALS